MHSIGQYVEILMRSFDSLGGNSVKASSGINGAGTETQRSLQIEDTVESLCVFSI